MSDTSFDTVSTQSASIERSSVAPVAISSFPPATIPAAPRPRWLVTSLLPVLSFVLAGAAAYASPAPKYQGPPAQPAITMPDVVVMDLPADSTSTPPADSPQLAAPSVWVYDLPIAGHVAPSLRQPAHTLSPDELPLARP